MNKRMGANGWRTSVVAVAENLSVRIMCYPVGHAFVAEIEADSHEHLWARGIAQTAAQSLRRAHESFSRRIEYSRCADLMVGG